MTDLATKRTADREELDGEDLIVAFECRTADLALIYLKQHGDILTLAEVPVWMDEFSVTAAQVVAHEGIEP